MKDDGKAVWHYKLHPPQRIVVARHLPISPVIVDIALCTRSSWILAHKSSDSFSRDAGWNVPPGVQHDARHVHRKYRSGG